MTPKERAVMQQALEALESYSKSDYIKKQHPKRRANGEKAITALRKALAVSEQRTEEQAEQEQYPTYGFCPICGSRGISRERRIDGNDTCANGHSYASNLALHIAPEKQAEQEPGFYGRAAARLSQRVKELELEQSGKWRDHVEHRMLTWKTSHMNESGDQLSLKDFMDEHILDDLIDFVCDEYTARTKDLTDYEIMDLVRDECVDMRWPSTPLFIARAVIAAYREKNK